MPQDPPVPALAALGDLAQLAASLAPLLNGTLKLPGERLAEIIGEIVLEVIRSQPDDVKKQVWDWWVEDQRRWRKLWGLAE